MALRPGSAQKAARLAVEQAPAQPDRHKTLIAYFEEAEEETRTARSLAERDRDYYDNKQLTKAELAILKKRGQPDVIINRVQTKVNYLLGYEASQRTDPRGYPRTPQDEEASEACTDALRYVRDKTDLAQHFSQVWDNMLVEGYGGAEINIETDAEGQPEIVVRMWHWDRLFYDPHSRAHDFADARYLGGVVWMDRDDAEEMWPDGKDAISRTVEEESTQTYADRPSWKQWSVGGNRKRVRIVQMWYREGATWHWCIFTKGGKLAGGEVPFRDEDSRSICNLLLQSAFVDRENNRYGFVRALIGPQDEINKRRSTLLHEAVSNQTIGEAGAVEDVDAMKTEAAKANGHIVVNPGMRFEFVDRTPKHQLHAQLLSEAKNEIDLQGPNAVMQGKGERGASGRAKMVDQQGGQIEIYRLVDRHNHFKRRCYKLFWAVIRQYWTAEKWIRVTDDEKNVKFVGLNRPVTMAEDLLKQAVNNGVPEEEAKVQLAEQAQANPLVMQQLQQVVRIENVPAQMSMDIILEEVPDSANIQQEQFEILASLAQAGVQFPPKVYIEASALRDKRKLLEIQEEAQNDPANAALAQANMEKLTAEIEKLKAEVEKLRADAIGTLAKADSLDGQFGAIVDPNIVSMPQGQTHLPAVSPEAQFQAERRSADQAAQFQHQDGQQASQQQADASAREQEAQFQGGYPPAFDPSFIPGEAPQFNP